MEDKRFDEIWEMAEAQHYAKNLMAGYPQWQHRRRVATGAVAMTLIMAGAAVPLLQKNAAANQHDGYMVAYCNKEDVSDQYWVDLAGEMLAESPNV